MGSRFIPTISMSHHSRSNIQELAKKVTFYKVRIEPFGCLIHSPEKAVTIELNREETREQLGYKGEFPDHPKGIISPRIVHLEITSECDRDPLCKHCYAHPTKYSLEETVDCLSTDDWKGVIKELGDAGVLQVTFGGGEPTCRGDLFDLAKYCKKNRLNLGMTTNGLSLYNLRWAINEENLGLFDQINFSVHNNFLIIYHSLLRCYGLTKLGINYLCYKPEIEHSWMQLKSFYEFSKSAKDVEVLLLSYKPQTIDEFDNIVLRSEILKMAKELQSLGANVALDGYTCNLCEGGYSFCDISSTGEVYPCSFVRESYGNVLEEPFIEIWNRMPRIDECPYN